MQIVVSCHNNHFENKLGLGGSVAELPALSSRLLLVYVVATKRDARPPSSAWAFKVHSLALCGREMLIDGASESDWLVCWRDRSEPKRQVGGTRRARLQFAWQFVKLVAGQLMLGALRRAYQVCWLWSRATGERRC